MRHKIVPLQVLLCMSDSDYDHPRFGNFVEWRLFFKIFFIRNEKHLYKSVQIFEPFPDRNPHFWKHQVELINYEILKPMGSLVSWQNHSLWWKTSCFEIREHSCDKNKTDFFPDYSSEPINFHNDFMMHQLKLMFQKNMLV